MSNKEQVISDSHDWLGSHIGAICQACGVSDDDPKSWQTPCPNKDVPNDFTTLVMIEELIEMFRYYMLDRAQYENRTDEDGTRMLAYNEPLSNPQTFASDLILVMEAVTNGEAEGKPAIFDRNSDIAHVLQAEYLPKHAIWNYVGWKPQTK